MSKRSPVAIFLAASALLSVNGIEAKASQANNHREVDLNQVHQIKKEPNSLEKEQIANHKHQKGKDMGGRKEWTTDQDINEEGVLDESAKKAAKEAEKENICIPIGEGENCW